MRNTNKSPKLSYSAMVSDVESDPESVTETGSPPTVNQFFRLLNTPNHKLHRVSTKSLVTFAVIRRTEIIAHYGQHETCERDILKTNEQMPIGASGPRGSGTKWSTLGVTRSKFKVKAEDRFQDLTESSFWIPGSAACIE